LDLAISNRESSVSVLLGDGSGTFGSRTDVPAGGGASGIASGDFDGDLRNDLAAANYGSVTVLLNRCAPPRDHPPVVTAPKAVSGAEGSEITFSISANDPDGPAISSLTADLSGLPVGNNATCTLGPSDTGGVFRWTPGFEDSRPEPYSVTFTAANVLSASATTKITVTDASIAGVCQARAFTTDGKGGIRLGGGKERRCVNLEPVGGSFSLGTVDVTSIVMKSHNTGSVEEIRASEVATGGDRDGNGVQEIAACFRKEDLRLLFSHLRGNNPVTITLEGRLSTGEIFRAQMDVLVNAGGGKLAAWVSPNPLNPEATLTFITTERGPLRVRLFDLNGRMIRSLLEESDASVGYHDVRIDGRDEHGGRLASGFYFYRID